MRRGLALAAVAGALVTGGCLGPCNVLDGCPSFTEDRARGDVFWPVKVVPIEPSKLAAELKPGDRVHLETIEQRIYRLRVESLHPQAFWAYAADHRLYEVRYDHVRRLGIVRDKDGDDYVGDFVWGVVTHPPSPW